jgi:hypothetical protein
VAGPVSLSAGALRPASPITSSFAPGSVPVHDRGG